MDAAPLISRQAELHRLETFYTQITVQSLPEIRSIYAPNAYFKDPFNEVTGIEAIERIFSHMFTTVTRPRFEVTSRLLGSGENGHEAFLVWLFHWRQASGMPLPAPIRGSSHIKFDALGRVDYHRDYWDAAEELYETLPVLGGVLRLIKLRIRA
jgi:steroid Delta-isomerase